MPKMWAGRTGGETEKIADELNSSVKFDQRMWRQDIRGSIAHAQMLQKCGIIPAETAEIIVEGLKGIRDDIESGKLIISPDAEDIHMFIEEVLTSRIGDAGKMLHTARSRNDQVALDLRLYLRDEVSTLQKLLKSLMQALYNQAEKNIDTVMPGYTHMQRAQPVLFAHYLLAYVFMLLRDSGRLEDANRRMNISPIGSAALAGTTYPTDRRFEAELLDFDDISQNSMDGVSDRDFCLEIMSDLSILMMHLSRLCEELVLWSSWEFGFVELSDRFTTGSSIMPQKKNPDIAELIRGKTGRVYGDLIGLLTVMKGLPLAYNKDMQEDKEAVFDALDTVKLCLKAMAPMVETFTVRSERMKKAAQEGFINATDLADYLTKKGLPFREAYRISGEIVALCIKKKLILETFPLEEYKKHSPLFEEDVYDTINIVNCVERRISEGGTGRESVLKELNIVRKTLM